MKDAAYFLAGEDPQKTNTKIDECNPNKVTVFFYWLKLEFVEKKLIPVSDDNSTDEDLYFLWSDIFLRAKKCRRDIDTQLVSIWRQIKVEKRINIRLNKAFFQYVAAILWDRYPKASKREVARVLTEYLPWYFENWLGILLIEQDEEQVYQMLKGMSPYKYTGNPKDLEEINGDKVDWWDPMDIFYDDSDDWN